MALTDINAYLPLPQGIATSGQPTVEQFAEIKAAGYGIVINLAMPTSENWLENEAAIVTALGMDYHPLPVQWDYPTLSDAEQLFEVLAQQHKNQVWVHCALNMRVSAMLYLYNRLHRAMDEKEALGYLQQIWTPNATWQRFIDAVVELYGD